MITLLFIGNGFRPVFGVYYQKIVSFTVLYPTSVTSFIGNCYEVNGEVGVYLKFFLIYEVICTTMDSIRGFLSYTRIPNDIVRFLQKIFISGHFRFIPIEPHNYQNNLGPYSYHLVVRYANIRL